MEKQKPRFLLLIFLLTGIFLAAGCGKSLEQQIAEQLELGQKYLEEQQYGEAIVAFTKVIELDEKQESAYVGLAQAYTETGQAAEAFETLEKAYDLFPTEQFKELLKDSCLNLIRFYMDLGDMDSALDIAQRTVEKLGRDQAFEAELAGLGLTVDEDGTVRLTAGDGGTENGQPESQPRDLSEAGNFDWDSEYDRLFDIVCGAAGAHEVNMTYDQIEETFGPLIPEVETLIARAPDRGEGYQLLGELYVLLGEMDRCLAIRTEGYEITGEQWLNPSGYTIDGGRYDGWGRDLSFDSGDGRIEYTFGEGQRVTHSRHQSVGSEETFDYDYSYDSEGRVCETTVSWGSSHEVSTYTYEGGGILTIHTDYYHNGQKTEYFTDETVTIDKYGKWVKSVWKNSDGDVYETDF